MVRLQKFLADAGVASRRASEQIILAGRVEVNGVTVRKLGASVNPPHDKVTVDGQPLRARRLEAEWLVKRVEEEITRSRGIAPADLLAEYQEALDIYREILRNAE